MNHNENIGYVYHNILNNFSKNVNLININGKYTHKKNIIMKIFNRHYNDNMNEYWYKENNGIKIINDKTNWYWYWY